MRKIVLLGLWVGFASVCHGQISTFPSPPQLSPPSDSAQATNTFPGTSSPDATSAVSPGSNPAASPAETPAPSTVPAAAAPVTAATITSMNALDDKVPLHPGDQVSFRVIEDRDDAVPRTVTDTGEVDFPYVGRLKVQGMTCRQVAEELKKLLEVDYYKRATVIVGLDVIKDRQTAAHDVAWIVGQVRQIGPQELSPVQPLTVSQMILRAGGFGDFADQRRIRVLHQSAPSSTLPDATAAAQTNKGSDMRVVDVKAVFEGKSKDDPIVLPNDLIVVPKRLVNF